MEMPVHTAFLSALLISESWIYLIVVRWNTGGSSLWDRAMDNFFLISDGAYGLINLLSDGEREREREGVCVCDGDRER
jgi:hypothetical protein